jgi:Ca2+-binding EF-hand superfamily protein
MKKLLVGGAAAALVVAITPASAQPAPPTPPGVAPGTAPAPVRVVPPAVPRAHMMVMSDKVMTRSEAVKHVRDLFARLDTNRDGYITKEEVEALHQKMGGMDAMHGEFGKRFAEGHFPMPDRAAMFDKLDTNHDGSISREEFMAAHPQLQERRVMILREGASPGVPSAPGEPGVKMRMHGMGMHSMGFGGHLFETADSNHDGRVSLAEAEAAALAHFDRADLNHDGKITPEERQQSHELHRQHRRS